MVQREDALLDLVSPALAGRHQFVNAGTAVSAALELDAVMCAEFGSGLGLDEQAIERGLTDVRWPARMQRLDSGPLPGMLRPGTELWLDGGHNPAAGQVLAQSLADLEDKSSKPLILIVGMMGLKDAAGFLTPFRGLARSVYTVPIPGAHEAPFAPDKLAEVAAACGLPSQGCAGIQDALRRADAAELGPKRILICGSLYLAGHVLGLQAGVLPQSN